mmetsp:Transcript_11650/g.35167  ORF Transcript_11650/g.35167 Transcript_11650/m.35167 type:complete len:102 (-) Transcript_11650:774-1079(-)
MQQPVLRTHHMESFVGRSGGLAAALVDVAANHSAGNCPTKLSKGLIASLVQKQLPLPIRLSHSASMSSWSRPLLRVISSVPHCACDGTIACSGVIADLENS